MRTKLLPILLMLTCGFASQASPGDPQQGIKFLDVNLSFVRVYDMLNNGGASSISEGEPAPGARDGVASFVLGFKEQNKEYILSQIVPQLVISELDAQGKVSTKRIPADIYRDDDGEYVAAIKDYNLERYFIDRKKPNWTFKDYVKEAARMHEKNFWKVRIMCEFELRPKLIITNERGAVSAPIVFDGFQDNASDGGHIIMDFHLGDLKEKVVVEDLIPQFYVVNKKNPGDVRNLKTEFTRKEAQYSAKLSAVVLIPFFVNNFGVKAVWNKNDYQQRLADLEAEWGYYIVGKKQRKLYHTYTFKDITLEDYLK